MKGKITSISNKQRSLWLYLKRDEKILNRLHKIISKFYKAEYDSFKDLDFRYKVDPESHEKGSMSSGEVEFLPQTYEELIGKIYWFFPYKFRVCEEDEALYLVFRKKSVVAILLKSSPKFEKLRKEFLKRF